MVGSRLFIFGGWDGSSRLNDFYCLEESKRREMTSATMEWSEILTSMLPTPRAGTTLTPVGEDKLFLFGGSGHYTTYYNDILIYDLSKLLPHSTREAGLERRPNLRRGRAPQLQTVEESRSLGCVRPRPQDLCLWRESRPRVLERSEYSRH